MENDHAARPNRSGTGKSHPAKHGEDFLYLENSLSDRKQVDTVQQKMQEFFGGHYGLAGL